MAVVIPSYGHIRPKNSEIEMAFYLVIDPRIKGS